VTQAIVPATIRAQRLSVSVKCQGRYVILAWGIAPGIQIIVQTSAESAIQSPVGIELMLV